jgi:glycosyltransferase involved in cell wall biosynthesis
MSRKRSTKREASSGDNAAGRLIAWTGTRSSEKTGDDCLVEQTLECPSRRERHREERAGVPIIVTLYHREDETRLALEQLARVTDNYSLVIIDNGFDDKAFLEDLNPAHYIRNADNRGAIESINQGLDLVDDEYVCVLHNDVHIFEEGWLDHIVHFLRHFDEAGLVGLAGRHEIGANGAPRMETTVANIRGYPEAYLPTWRFTEVAAIDGLGWVMRNEGFRLEEDFGMMHFYDLDLSMRYVEAGLRVFVCGVDIYHLAEDERLSNRSDDAYLAAVGGDDLRYFEQVREKFRKKWAHMLPIRRGSRDESYLGALPGEYTRLIDEFEKKSAGMKELEHYIRKLECELEIAKEELEKAGRYARGLEATVERLQAGGGPAIPGTRPLRSI